MPAFPLTEAQIDDLIAYVLWARDHPGEMLPTPVPTSVPGGGPTVPSFSNDILPLLQKNCGATCHSATTASGGFRAVDYAGVRAVVLPGNPAGSRLVQVQQGSHPVRLTEAELQQVMAWILAGAPDN